LYELKLGKTWRKGVEVKKEFHKFDS